MKYHTHSLYSAFVIFNEKGCRNSNSRTNYVSPANLLFHWLLHAHLSSGTNTVVLLVPGVLRGISHIPSQELKGVRSCFVFGICSFRILGEKLDIAMEFLRGYPPDNSRIVPQLGHDNFSPNQFNSSLVYHHRYWEGCEISDKKLFLFLITLVSLRKYILGFDRASWSLCKMHAHIRVLQCHMTHKSPLMSVTTAISYVGYVMKLCVPQNLCSDNYERAMAICEWWTKGNKWEIGRGPLYGSVR